MFRDVEPCMRCIIQLLATAAFGVRKDAMHRSAYLSKRNKMKKTLALLTLAVVAAAANAQVIDGTANDAAYGAAKFVQTSATQFGNATNGELGQSLGGSEINQVFATYNALGISIAVTGNLENNYNKLALFIDTGNGGENVIGATQGSTTDFGWLGSLNGLTFDAGFNASHALWYRYGGGGAPNQGFVSLASLGASGSDIINASNNTLATNAVSTIVDGGFSFAFNHSNTAGVDGGSAAGASSVLTGMEVFIPWASLGVVNPGIIKVAGFVSSSGQFLSNQVIGGDALANNLGNAGQVNFANIAGNQYVEVVPEPMTMTALGLGLAALAARKRRKA